MFPCEFGEYFKNIFFVEPLRTPASDESHYFILKEI